MTIITIILGIMLIMLAICLLINIFALIKNEIVYYQRSKIIEAIRKYHIHCINHDVDELVSYVDMEEYNDTMKRFWDFGYTRILPKDKFEIIKPYIDDRKKG